MNESGYSALTSFAINNGIDNRILLAILNNESNQKGFYKNDRIKSRFEKHIFYEFTLVYIGKHSKHKYLPKFDTDWVRKYSLDDLELLSTSWGIAQIMGYHYETIHYWSVQGMVEQWRLSENMQITDFINFCTVYRNGKFMKALQDSDIESISKMYNGGGYKKNRYAEKIKEFIV